MSSTLEALFISYRTRNVDFKCCKELGLAIKHSTEHELNTFFESYKPDELHLQLLQLCVARNSGHYGILFDGLKAESKRISNSCVGIPALYSTNSKLLNVEFLLPFLQSLSHSIRSKLIWNLGKFMPLQCEAKADDLFNAIVGTWGISIAIPLLCKCSEELIKRELPFIHSLQTFQLMALARRHPYLALSYLEKNSVNSDKAIKYIVRATLPQSLKYCADNSYHAGKLSKSTMKVILRKHSQVILESPSKWTGIFDEKLVHKILKPDVFEQFLSKPFLELEKNDCIPSDLLKYFALLLPVQVSSILHKLLQIKYRDIPFDSNFDYWKEKRELLQLMHGNDRNAIAGHLNTLTKGNEWVTLMTCDKSIDIIKNDLRFEADAYKRSLIFGKLMETVEINKDSKALEEVCKFVADRYRNDKNVLNAFFEKVPDLSSVSQDTWSAVLAMAHKFFDPSDWMTCSASKVFTFALKRDPDMYLKLFIEKFMSYSWSYMSLDNLHDLKEELRSTCVDLVFTQENLDESVTDYSRRSALTRFLPLISKWNEKSSTPTIYPNVNAFVLNLFAKAEESERYNQDASTLSFVRNKNNGFGAEFIESLIQNISTPEILQHHLSRHLPFPNTKDIADKTVKDIFRIGPFRYIGAIEKMKKLGYLEFLKYLAEKSKDELKNITKENCKYAIFLLSLTTDNMDDFFSIIDSLLPSADYGKRVVTDSEVKPEELDETKKQEFVLKGIGLSFSHIDRPSLSVARLLKFCVNGDLMLFVRDALYSVCRSLPHDEAQRVILSLVQSPVSVQKHALRLHQLVSNVQSRLDLLMNLLEGEGHITTRTILIQSAINCLNETRTVATWQVTKEIMSRLTPSDESIIIWLVQANVPDPFVEEYFQILLEKVKILKDLSPDIIANTLLAISNKHAAISETFLTNLLREYFLSECLVENHHHAALFYLLKVYLKGSKLSTIPSSLPKRQQFLVELLKTNANEAYINSYDSKRCSYPGRILLIYFIDTFCSQCLDQTKLEAHETGLSLYINNLLDYLSHFDKNIFFKSFTMLSIIQIGENSPNMIGQSIGQFCDDCLQKHPFHAHYTLPVIMTTYFKDVYCTMFNTSQLASIMVGLLPPAGVDETVRILRLVVLAHILPSDWISDSAYEPFRLSFLPLIKNTVAEFMLFSC